MKQVLRYLPGIKALSRRLRKHYTGSTVREPYPRGHFHSPLPDYEEIELHAKILDSRDVDLESSISLRPAQQLALFEQLSKYYGDFDWPEKPSPNFRFYLPNGWFDQGDSISLFYILRHIEPKRVIEVGSGLSSALMLDINDRFLNGSVHFTFIEPFPERLISLLHDQEQRRFDMIQKKAQDVPLSIFAGLDANDILFIDSSHVSKMGSDVNFLLFQVIPQAKPGVVIHFHDILWPFEYPRSWIMQGCAWNEAYLLRAFLQYNKAFEILLFNSFLGYRHHSAIAQLAPRFLENPGGSLWIRKLIP
jgi:hypothetical protein